MTVHHEFDRQLADWLHESSAHRVPDHVIDVLLVTRATRQRPWWSSLGRWLPMQVSVRTRPFVPPNLTRLLILAILIVALAGLALWFAGTRQPRLPAPFGPARNGDFVLGADGDIERFDPGTGSRTPLITGPTWDFGGTFSRDGTKLAFGRLEHDPALTPGVDPLMTVALANPDGTNVRELTKPLAGDCWSDWSPDGREIVLRTERPDHYGLLNILDVESGDLRTIDPGISVRCSALGYRAPDGAEIVFRGDTDSDHGVFAIHPDGTGFRRVNTEIPICDCDTGVLSSDGRFMAVDRWDGSGFVRLWLLDLASGKEQLVALPPDRFARGGTFSPDSSLIAFPMLRQAANGRNAYTVGIAPVDARVPARSLGPEMLLPPTGTDEAFVSIAFSPDGKTLIAIYPDSPTSVKNTVWLLPVDGSPGQSIGRGTFASLDVQRRAP